jgi:hypothetical protein
MSNRSLFLAAALHLAALDAATQKHQAPRLWVMIPARLGVPPDVALQSPRLAKCIGLLDRGIEPPREATSTRLRLLQSGLTFAIPEHSPASSDLGGLSNPTSRAAPTGDSDRLYIKAISFSCTELHGNPWETAHFLEFLESIE